MCCDANGNIQKGKRQPTEKENIFSNPILDKGFVSRKVECLQLNNRKIIISNPTKKRAKDLNRR